MGFFGAFLSAFGQGAAVLALDAAAALLNGPKPEHQQQLKNKAFRSDAHGTPWPRCRGRVRLQGKDLWGTQIQRSIWKTVGGGLFGIGSKSVYYDKYSTSTFVGFGMKLGGGAAVDILRIWADGKLLFNKVVSTGSSTGTVTVTVVGGGQQPGSQFLQITLASGASVSYNAGDLLSVPGDPQPYAVQSNVSGSGPGTLSVPIWPPLRVNLGGGGAVTLAMGTSSGVYDLSSFDPIPHDGSHPNGGYPCPPGGIRFYLGSDTQLPDPTIVHWLGAGNVPGYRGIVGVMLHDLQLANYGDHRPAITAEIAFDVASPIYPIAGPVQNLAIDAGINSRDVYALPFSGTSSLFFKNPLQNLPYIWVVTCGPSGAGFGPPTLSRVNTLTNQLEASITLPAGFDPQFTTIADNDGFVYMVSPDILGSLHYVLYKYDGLSMTLVGDYGGNPTDASVNQPGSLYAFDTYPSLFGTNVQIKLIADTAFFGGVLIMDRTTPAPFGILDNVGGIRICAGYTASGQPIMGSGTPTSYLTTFYSGGFGATLGTGMCVDTNGNLWLVQHDKLSMYDLQFQGAIAFDAQNQPIPYLALPSFARTDFDISAVSSSGASIYYSAGDNTIVILANLAIAKFDIATSSIILTNTSVGFGSSNQDIDIMGTLIVGGGEPFYYRVDTSTLAVTATYYVPHWLPASPAHGVYDQSTDSVWHDSSGGLYRVYLDRGSGAGIGLDTIVASLMADAGYV